MYLTHLSLTNFRTFKRLEIDVPSHVTLMVGDNAQGKTSFLEAVFFFSALTSVQSGRDRELINFEALSDDIPVARLVMDFMRQGKMHKMEVRLIIGNGGNGNGRLRKEVLIDDVKRPLQQALGNFNSVIFLPQMTDIIEDGPDVRRRYLDMTISQVYPGYARELSRYNQTLSQRNALLKNLAEHGGDMQQLDFWDERVADKGSFVMRTRMQMLKEFETAASQVHMGLSGQRSGLQIEYQPGFDFFQKLQNQRSLDLSTAERWHYATIEQDELQRLFMEELKRIRQEEVRRGVTTIGPHRDELRFIANEVDAGTYGSRGQIRTVMMALKLGELHWLHEKTGEYPVLLLDETMAELDLGHREALLDALEECEQAILTTTDASMFKTEFLSKCALMQVHEGRIQLQNET